MVKVKRGGKWVTVRPGQTVGRVSVPSRSSSSGSSGSSSGSSSGRTVPYDFVGPLRPGTTREQAPAQYQGPVQPGTDEASFRSSGRSSSGTTTAQQITDALKTSTANINVYNYEKGIETSGRLGIAPASNILIDKWYANQQSQTGSSYMPAYATIKEEERKGNIGKETALKSMGVYYGQEYQEKYTQASTTFNKNLFEEEARKRETAQQYYQGRIDTGEDYSKVNTEYDDYIKSQNINLANRQQDFTKNWETTTGSEYKVGVNKIMFDQALLYDSERAKGEVFSSFTSGIKTGAITTGGFMALSKWAPRVASVGSKFVATPVMVAYGVYAYGTSGYSGYKNYKTARGLGFTQTQAVQRGVLSGANTISGPAFFSAGAVSGGLAVTGTTMAYKNLRTTGRMTGYTSAEQGRINKMLGRKDALKIDLKKGEITDIVGKSKTGRITAGSSTRSYNVKINTEGLSKPDIKLANKFNLRGTINQQLTGTGKRISGFEAGQFKTGGMFGKTTTTFTNIQGTIKGSSVKGFTSTLTNTGRTTGISSGIFKGTGSVKTPNVYTRLEGSSSTSQTLFRATYTKDASKLLQLGRPSGSWKYSTTPGTARSNTVAIGSRLKQINLFKTNAVNVQAKTYGDVTEWKPGYTPKFKVTKVPSTRSFSYDVGGTSSGGATGQIFKQTTTFKPTAPITTTSIIAPQYQATSPGFVSAYAGTGQYELTQFNKLKMKPTPSSPVIMEQGVKLLPITTQSSIPKSTTATAPQRAITLPPQTITTPIQTIIQKPIQRQRPRTIQGGQILQPLQTTALSPILSGGYGFTPTPSVPTRPTWFPPISLPMGSWPQATTRAIGGRKAKTGYNPSFKAMFFKIKGKKTTGVKTGFNFRPIVRKVKRVRK